MIFLFWRVKRMHSSNPSQMSPAEFRKLAMRRCACIQGLSKLCFGVMVPSYSVKDRSLSVYLAGIRPNGINGIRLD